MCSGLDSFIMNSALEKSLNPEPAESKSRKGRLPMKEHEVRAYLKSWKDNVYINRFIKKGCSKHPLFLAISRDLRKSGYSRTINEIYHKMKNLTREYRKAKLNVAVNNGIHYKYFYEIDEILKKEAEIGTKGCPGSTNSIQIKEKPEIVLDGSHVKGVTSENVQVIRLSVPDVQDLSDSNIPQSFTVLNNSESEIQNETEGIQIPLPSASGSNYQESPEDILVDFYQEFQRSNRKLEENDAAMLELFKEQNDIFRTQTTLLMKLLLK